MRKLLGAAASANEDSATKAYADSVMASRLTPVRTIRTAGDFSLAAASIASWTDLESLSPGPFGTSSARPLDVVVPNLAVGRTVWAHIETGYGNQAQATLLDVATIVSGAAVHRIGNSTTGITGGGSTSGAYNYVNTLHPYIIQTGDLDGTDVRFRIQVKTLTGSTTKTLYAGTLELSFSVFG